MCDVLGIKNVSDALNKLRDKQKDDIGLTDAIGRTQDTVIVSEGGMYRLVLRSRKKQAEAFQVWVEDEVLPSIRKTGQYSVEQAEIKPVPTNLDILQGMLDMLKQNEQRLSNVELENIKLKEQLKEQQEVIESVEMPAEASSQELERSKNGHGYWYSIIGYAAKHGLGSYSAKMAAALGRKATALCKQMGIVPEKINDPRFGLVNAYPEHILAEVM